jgi:segregation and condensation protein B
MSGDNGKAGQESRVLPLKALVESLLFAASEPVDETRLATILEVDVEELQAALGALAAEYEERGLRLQRKGTRVQLVTAPEAAGPIRRLLGLELTGSLSPAALETLAIVAYTQPATRAQVESVRGVNSDSVLRTLVNHGLIEEQGRLSQAGRPIVYGTTFEFLNEFGLSDLSQLPPLEEWGKG